MSYAIRHTSYVIGLTPHTPCTVPTALLYQPHYTVYNMLYDMCDDIPHEAHNHHSTCLTRLEHIYIAGIIVHDFLRHHNINLHTMPGIHHAHSTARYTSRDVRACNFPDSLGPSSFLNRPSIPHRCLSRCRRAMRRRAARAPEDQLLSIPCLPQAAY